MIEDLGIAEPVDIGYYSGLVDSCFALMQVFTVSLKTCVELFLLLTFIIDSSGIFSDCIDLFLVLSF